MIQLGIDARAVLSMLIHLLTVSTGMRPVMADIAGALESESERQFRTEAGTGRH